MMLNMEIFANRRGKFEWDRIQNRLERTNLV